MDFHLLETWIQMPYCCSVLAAVNLSCFGVFLPPSAHTPLMQLSAEVFTLKRLVNRSSLGRSRGSPYKPWRPNTHLRRTSGIWKVICMSVQRQCRVCTASLIASFFFLNLCITHYATLCVCCRLPCRASSSPCIWGSYHWEIQNCRASSTNPTPPYR